MWHLSSGKYMGRIAIALIIDTMYKQRFSLPRQHFTVHVISTDCLRRIVAQSLYGLVSFLCTRYHGLSPDETMERLLVAGANLQSADSKLCGAVFTKDISRHSWFNPISVHCTFWDQHDRVRSKVKAALGRYNEDKVSKYSIHVICGVNELVSGPTFSVDEEVRSYNPATLFKYHQSRINFLTKCEEAEGPVLFFAECSNHDTMAWCIPVICRGHKQHLQIWLRSIVAPLIYYAMTSSHNITITMKQLVLELKVR
uniref:Uncharacterized protein n=1 Tax=Oryza meridionalis TaxID=40149 RepID=A0A0E0DVW4_9ORYZ